ncbi:MULTISPECIES: acetylornithine transaminase [unclassified Thioalkalivibrio]|uniref:acetylornithine transaminase n=1 Tax=unclassified Thioalkalivibrio TaxID=2621013 RepID=UPI00035E34F0|nr:MULTISPECIES: acetylornithine transaminase [unclassified Thioalkalivibrio]
MSDVLQNTYSRLPVAFERGEGAWLWDTEGKRYLDALSGIAVCGLGHAHPKVAHAICDQAQTLVHTSNLFRIPLQEQLARRLCALAQMEQAFFCNSGAEANEAAIKLARLHARRRGIAKPKVIVMHGSFHGRTLATLSATGNEKIHAGFEPLVEGFVHVPHGDAEAVAALSNDPDVVAILVEPITGEGGIHVPPPGYLRRLRELADQHDWLLMLDEIQAGIGRTGHWFAFQHEGITPDVISLAKGLGNGIPIGANLVAGRASGLFTPGTHGTTFGGNPLVCRAALAVLDVMQDEGLCEEAGRQGEILRRRLADRLEDKPGVVAVRGRGLMIGIELDRPAGTLVQAALDAGLILNVTAQRVIRLLPPLIVDDAQVDQIASTVADLVDTLLVSEDSREAQA